MKKKKIIVIVTIIVSIVALLCYGVYWAFFDMGRLPKDRLISEVESPDGSYSINAYISDGGATTSYAILGELNYNKVKKKPKNIYWNYREDSAKIEWVNDFTVIINGHKLDVRHDTFDWRRNK